MAQLGRLQESLIGHPKVFHSVIEPYLWQAEDYGSMWRIGDGDMKDLYANMAGQSSSPARLGRALAPACPGKSLTYGEVLSPSVAAHVYPGLRPALECSESAALQNSASVVDCGSGTGKIPAQIALMHDAEQQVRTQQGQRLLPALTCVGLELATERHAAGMAAMARARVASPALLLPLLEEAVAAGEVDLRSIPGATLVSLAGVLSSALHRLGSTGVQLHRADILTADLSSFTGAFVNNKVFEPSLMEALATRLASITECPNLRAVVMINPLCVRHRERCVAKGSACAAFHEPVVGMCNPSWDGECSLYWYYPARFPDPRLSFPGTEGSSRAAGAGGHEGVRARVEGKAATPRSPPSARHTVSIASRTASNSLEVRVSAFENEAEVEAGYVTPKSQSISGLGVGRILAREPPPAPRRPVRPPSAFHTRLHAAGRGASAAVGSSDENELVAEVLDAEEERPVDIPTRGLGGLRLAAPGIPIPSLPRHGHAAAVPTPTPAASQSTDVRRRLDFEVAAADKRVRESEVSPQRPSKRRATGFAAGAPPFSASLSAGLVTPPPGVRARSTTLLATPATVQGSPEAERPARKGN